MNQEQENIERNSAIRTFRLAPETGDLDKMKKLHDIYAFTDQEAGSCNKFALKLAMQFGHEMIASWLQETFNMTATR